MAKFVPMNATVTKRVDMHSSLMIIRVVPDDELFPFEDGQYTVLGMHGSAPRSEYSDPEEMEVPEEKMVKRAYSISSSSLQGEYIEFYISLVRSGQLTPRLFQLKEGERVFLGHKATGHFTLDQVIPGNDLLMISTGTGLAPFVAMVKTELRAEDARRLIVVHGARHAWDLGYRSEFEMMDRKSDRLIYIPTITRAEKDTTWNGHIGRVNTVIEERLVEKRIGGEIEPAKMSVFLCGNPDMVDQMESAMLEKGFQSHSKKEQGTLHVEKYW